MALGYGVLESMGCHKDSKNRFKNGLKLLFSTLDGLYGNNRVYRSYL